MMDDTALLHPLIVATTDNAPPVHQNGADGNAPDFLALAGFLNGGLQKWIGLAHNSVFPRSAAAESIPHRLELNLASRNLACLIRSILWQWAFKPAKPVKQNSLQGRMVKEERK